MKSNFNPTHLDKMGMVSTNGQQTKVQIFKVTSPGHFLGTLTMCEALHWSGDTEIKEGVSGPKELTAFWI